ncbi:MAG: hypothetical protein JNK93_08440 [Planctomycetia bacterium]|nr:hypothetical protein [Planctomycetia bacterium]
MNRRQFLGLAPVLFAGCSRPVPPAPRADRIAREKHLAMLDAYRVPAGSVRTTPKPDVDPLARFPELKPLARIAVRLHPRFGDEPRTDESKLGGAFHWPVAEPWPQCPEHRLPMVAVLQVRTDDLPPQFPMRPKTDLFQLFWSPRATKAGPPHVVGVWRARDGDEPIANPEIPESADLGYVPVACRIFPERSTELPPLELMPESMRRTVAESQDLELPARGVKFGGWPRVPDRAPKCATCVHPMDYLLSVDSCEWTAVDATRWKPMEDADVEGYRRAAGFDFGAPGAAIQVHVCRRCEAWPLRAAVVS